MHIARPLSVLTLSLALFGACRKEAKNYKPPVVNHALGRFSITVSNRTATAVNLSWNGARNTLNSDTVKYKVILNGSILVSDKKDSSYTITGLVAGNTYSGIVQAYTMNGDTATARFSVDIYIIATPTYNYVTGYYKVTESTKPLSGGTTVNYTFAAQAVLINDSTIRFIQHRRVPRTWWTEDYDTQIFPLQNDSLMGMGTSPRGRILNTSTIRMGYIYGTSIVYDVKQLWEKLANPADTALITYTYPNVLNMISTIAGNNLSGMGSGSSGDGGPATEASLMNPMDVVADGSGNIYFTDGGLTYSIRKVDANGIITRFAGNNTAGFSGDGGPAAAAQINYPRSLALDLAGNLYIADAGNYVIRKVSTNGTISTIAGTPGVFGFSGDGGPATSATLGAVSGITIDGSGNIYLCDPGKHCIRKINTSGTITTIAGTPNTNGYSGDGGPAASAKLDTPTDLCMDLTGNLYIADKANHCIRKVNTSGTISTYAGIGGFFNAGFSGDGGAAIAAKLNNPQGLSADISGNIYISDYSNNRIRKVTAAGVISTIAGNGQAAQLGDGPDFFGGDYGPATSAAVPAPYGNCWLNNKLYIAANYRIRRISF